MLSNLVLSFPDDGKLRARKVVTRSRARITGKFPSTKAKRMVQWESKNELFAFRLLEVNPDVVSFKEQPLVIQYTLDGIKHRHYPDVLIHHKKGNILWEVKTPKDALDPEIIQRTQCLTKALVDHGYEYRLMTSDILAREPRMTNALKLLKFGRQPMTPLERDQVRHGFRMARDIPWSAIRQGALGDYGRFHVCRLYLEGVVDFDINQVWTDETVFTYRPTSTAALGS